MRSKPAKTGFVGFKKKYRFYGVMKMKNKRTLRMVIFTTYCNDNTLWKLHYHFNSAVVL